MQKFNGKIVVGEGAETNSEMTNVTRQTKKSTKSNAVRFGSPGADELDEAATMGRPMDNTLNDRDLEAGESFMQAAADEEEAMEMKEEEQKKDVSPLKDFFRDPVDGQPFDPIKKFGLIEDNSLLYDNITTSYPLNLPTDYYQKYISSKMPTKEAGNGKWFIRPHHVETLTNHPLSVQDDVLNTRYYSHYNQNYGKKEERNDNAEAIVNIEKHLETLKAKQQMMMFQKGLDVEAIERLKEDTKLEGAKKFDEFINDKTRFASKELIIQAYEAVLMDKRHQEMSILNGQRFKEYEKNRPPQNNWFELKGGEFSKELYRNRMALKPNDSNSVYLQTLQDKNLY